MNRTITISGIGHVQKAPDQIEIDLQMTTRNKTYVEVMKEADEKIHLLQEAIVKAGLLETDLRTTDYDVMTDYGRNRDQYGNYSPKYFCYVVSHSFSLRFDFSLEQLAKVLEAITECGAKPQFSIHFTLKDLEGAKAEVMRDAVRKARQEAQLLCDAAGAKLGDLITVDHSWNEINLYSSTRYALAYMACDGAVGSAPMTPEDVDLKDTIRFTWAIE